MDANEFEVALQLGLFLVSWAAVVAVMGWAFGLLARAAVSR